MRGGSRLTAVPVVLGVLALAACSSAHRAPARHAVLTVTPNSALSDAPLTVQLHGLTAGSAVTVSAAATDIRGIRWAAHATYRVPRGGSMTLSQAATAGSYTGVDPMGLVLFMSPANNRSDDLSFVSPRSGTSIIFTATVGGTKVATATAFRRNRYYQARVRALRPATDGVYGELYTPEHATTKRPGVLVFGGSEGGLSGGVNGASALAAHGYPSLGLAYFGEPGLPPTLEDVPLEYFAKALAVLRAQPGVDPDHLLVFGVSRGGEAALLLAARYPSLIHGVIAGVPNASVYTPTSWTVHGAEVPAGPIAVENIRGPVLLNCGTEDAVWTSCAYVDAIRARLTAHHFRYPVKTLRFAGAGHLVGAMSCCSATTPGLYERYGGTERPNADAQVTGSKALLAFLADQ